MKHLSQTLTRPLVLLAMGILALPVMASAETLAYVDYQDDPSCQAKTIKTGTVYDFSFDENNGDMLMLSLSGVDGTLSFNGKPMDMETWHNGETGEAGSMAEIVHTGKYRLNITQGGQGSICLMSSVL